MLLATLTRVVAVSALAHSLIAGARIVAPDAVGGRNLQTTVTVRVPDLNPRRGL